MIFKQVQEIITGQKTQTRRAKKDNERAMCINDPVSRSLNRHKQIDRVEIVDEKGNTRIKWQVGREYAVVPKRGMPQVYYRMRDDVIELAHETWDGRGSTNTWLEDAKVWESSSDAKLWYARAFPDKPKPTWRTYLEDENWKPLSIRIKSIRLEPLQSITETDAIAEGIEDYYEPESDFFGYRDYLSNQFRAIQAEESYKSLWESINGKGSWDDNPDVWVLEFEAVTHAI